jgi:hypothetical protein
MLATSSQHARHKLVTSLATCTLCRGRREGGATWKKCCNTMFGYWSQHARHKLAACSPQTRNIARNMYTISGEEGRGHNMEKCSQHGKRCSQLGKSVRTWENVLATWKMSSQHRKRCSQHSQHTSQHHDPTVDLFPDSNHVARKGVRC